MKSEIFAGMMLLLIPISMVYAESDDQINPLLQQANEFFENENYAKANSIYDEILKTEPDNLSALSKKGEVLLKLEKTPQAIKFFEKVLAIQLFYSDDTEKAYYQRILELDPNNIVALYSKGSYLIFYDNFIEQALETFDQILQIQPNHVQSLLKKGDGLLKLGKNVEAIWTFNKVLELELENVDALSKKGNALARQGSFEEATLFLEKSLEIEPKNIDSLYLMGDSLLRQGNYYDSATYLYEVVKLDPNHFLASSKLQITTGHFGHKLVDGYMETTLHDSNGSLVSHMRITPLGILNHEIAENLVESWPVTEIVNRDGQDFEVHKFQRERAVNRDYNVWGGATHYGINIPTNEKIWLVYANYWMYLPAKGDTITYTYTIFTPAE